METTIISSMADKDDEIFFGPLSENEIKKFQKVTKKLEKNRRKTFLYQSEDFAETDDGNENVDPNIPPTQERINHDSKEVSHETEISLINGNAEPTLEGTFSADLICTTVHYQCELSRYESLISIRNFINNCGQSLLMKK